ncbi:RND transporter [Pseudonocardia alni]|uniref:RND transporter n=1 Tax=Pseudonocardia alni TaxID=33907 RepID=UPI0034113BE0
MMFRNLSPARAWRALTARPGRRRVGAVVALLGTAAVVVLGLLQITVDTRASSFLPERDPVAQATDRAASAFGGDPVVVLLESDQPHALTSGEELSTLLRLEGRLSAIPDVAAVYGPATVLNQIAGRTQEFLGELTGRRDGIRIDAERRALEAGASQPASTAAGREAVAAFDARYGRLIVRGLPAGLPTLRNQNFVDTVLYGGDREPQPQWRFVVPSPQSVAVLVRPRQDLDQAGAERLTEAVRTAVTESAPEASRATVSGVPVVSSAMAAQVRHEVPILGGIALLAVGAWFAGIRWVPGRRRRLLPLASTVAATAVTLSAFGWIGRPLSLGIVAFLPILIGVGSDFMAYVTRGVDRRVVVSVALAAAASFASLAVATPVRAIQDLGLALGAGMVVALGTSLLIARWTGTATPEDDRSPSASPVRKPTRTVRTALVVTLVAVTTAGWALLPFLPLRADVQDFARGVAVLDDADHVEQVIGSSGELSVLVSAPNVLDPATVGWMTQARQDIVAQHGDRLRPIISPPDLLGFLGGRPSSAEIDSAVRLLPGYLTGAVTTGDRSLAVMSFGVRFDSAADMTELRDEVLASIPPPPSGVGYSLSGLPMMAAASYDSISTDRYLANVAGIVAAGAVLVALLRRRADAALAVTAAVVATGAGLLAIAATGIGLTPITVALGSLTAAVGCEFTVVLAESARRGDRRLRRSAVVAAAASATGYAVLAFSQLSIVSEFGVLLAGSVGLAYASAALVVHIAGVGTTGAGSGHDSPSSESPRLVGARR